MLNEGELGSSVAGAAVGVAAELPEVDSHELARSMLQRGPRGPGRGPSAAPGARLLEQTTSAMPASAHRAAALS